ncbi:OmpA family protein [candidate division WOR-3 bacterium]|nr:OmpA family protein [candidate division WOR-3 bacterium]
MKRLLFILLFLTTFILNAEYINTSNMIDIPTSNIVNSVAGIEINGSFSTPLSTNAPDHVYYNMAATFGIANKAQVTLHYYTLADWSLDGRFSILKGNGLNPGVAIGISDLTYRKKISPVGRDSSGVLSDWNYTNRPFENASVYLVATSEYNDMLKFNLGIGRGKYVGYGPISHYFNPSVLASNYTTVSGDWYFGLFIGAEYKVFNNLYLNAEFDGRDANAGIKLLSMYMNRNLQAGLSFTHIEQLYSGSGNTPSVNFSLTIQLNEETKKTVKHKTETVKAKPKTQPKVEVIVPAPTEGELIIRVLNANTKVPVLCDIIVYDSLIDKVKELEADENGTVKTKLNFGKYSIEVIPMDKDFIRQTTSFSIDTNRITYKDVFLLKKRMKIVFRNIHFNSNKASIMKESYPVLDSIGIIMKDNPNVFIRINGYTDSRGQQEYNLRLSKRRSLAVKYYLMKNFNIQESTIVTKGYGETKPIIYPENNETDYLMNRRVEFEILGEMKSD